MGDPVHATTRSTSCLQLVGRSDLSRIPRTRQKKLWYVSWFKLGGGGGGGNCFSFFSFGRQRTSADDGCGVLGLLSEAGSSASKRSGRLLAEALALGGFGVDAVVVFFVRTAFFGT